MRMLLLALATCSVAMFAAPQIVLACHKGTPHGPETSCNGGPPPPADDQVIYVTMNHGEEVTIATSGPLEVSLSAQRQG